MYMSKLVGERTKENPSDAIVKSHRLLVRAGFIKSVAGGIYSFAMPAKRIAQKIEAIVRDEMNKIEGQECQFPVVMPREMWEESGRFSSIGSEMLRFKDRNGRDMLLGMTHEEAAVHFARDAVTSYQQLPFMIYQFQTKFRDEARSRGGLIRVREFTMKDAYSFHIDQEDLEKYYQRAYDAYNNIFRRIGLKRFVAVKSDTGMMGGSVAHEYMLLTPIGEDTIVICPECGYMSNMEVATSVIENVRDEVSEPVKEVFTGDKHDIESVCEFLKVPATKTIKAVAYMLRDTYKPVVAFIRGDREINETKLRKIAGGEIVPADLSDYDGLVAGNIGCLNLNLKDAVIVVDESLKGCNNMVTGANRPEYHLTGVDVDRDLKDLKFADVSKVIAGERCPVCGKPLTVENGIEIGNIFQLGTKYTKSMNMTVLDRNGKSVNPIMGCYGIGIGRAIASVAEEYADDKGLVWPMQIAPFHVSLCPLRLDDETVKATADKLYKELTNAGVEVIYDDRNVSPGFKFADCDLMGIPLRLVVSPRSLQNGEVELAARDGSFKTMIKTENAVEEIAKLVSDGCRI